MSNTAKTDTPNTEKLFTRNFWLLCSSSLIFMMSFSMILPELPEFISSLGGEDYIGFIVGLFTISAGISRFWSGRLADNVGRVKVILLGTLVTAVCGILYTFVAGVFSFLLLRFIHGLCTGWRPTGATAYLADISPRKRLGEAMGYLGVAGSTGMALGPAIGSLVKEEISFDAMFLTSSVFGIIALLLSLRLPESLPTARKIRLSDLNIMRGKNLNFNSWPPSLITMFETYSFGAIITISPIVVDHLGFTYKGMFNLTFVFSSIAMRVIAGRASDRYGRKPLLIIGLVFSIAGMIIIGYAQSKLAVSIGGVLYGISIGINRPTIFAWTANMAKPTGIAVSLATMLLALEIGIGAGAFISGAIYSGSLDNIPLIFNIAGAMGLIALLVVIFIPTEQQSSKA
jgi:MFS family permease